MRLSRIVVIGAICALAGAAAGIAGSVASSSHGHHGGRHFAPFFGGPFGGGPVHVEAVVPNKAGNGFQTITADAGAFKSLSGNQLTITEGTKSVTYKTVTLTIPSGATIRRNGASANLGDLKSGDRVRVLQSPNGTFVMAGDAQHQGLGGPFEYHRGFRGGPPGGRHGFGHGGFGHGGFGHGGFGHGRFGPGGPPPGF
jgi:hypothetical protein